MQTGIVPPFGPFSEALAVIATACVAGTVHLTLSTPRGKKGGFIYLCDYGPIMGLQKHSIVAAACVAGTVEFTLPQEAKVLFDSSECL